VSPVPQFIIRAFDLERWCPVLEAKFEVPDQSVLQRILGGPAADDPDLSAEYEIGPSEVAAINSQFFVGFTPELLEIDAVEIFLFKRRASLQNAPYLIHTGYELPLLLDGRKKLARMYSEFPPHHEFAGEDKFDRWVHEGVLHKDVTNKPFKKPVGNIEGIRTVRYAPKGEEWRIEADKLIWKASDLSGCWNEHFERLEGMLFGYQDWENDWWIERYVRRRHE
jgi:hypothetical protein